MTRDWRADDREQEPTARELAHASDGRVTSHPSIAAPRVASADEATKLEAISGSGACAEGRVITLDFRAIRNRLQDRWSLKRNDVFLKLEDIIKYHVGARSIWLRVQESEYIICFSEDRGAAAQAIGFLTMEQALKHFLGQFTADDFCVNAVTSIEGRQIERAPIKAGSPAPASSPPPGVKRAVPEAAERASPVLVGGTAERLRLSHDVQEIVSLNGMATVGFRIAPRFYKETSGKFLTIGDRAGLSTHSLLAMDQQVIQAIANLFQERHAKSVVSPISLLSLGSGRGRLVIMDNLNGLSDVDRSRLVIELVGFEAGTPSSKLIEAAHLLQPFCRYVGAQTAPSRTGLKGASGARLPSVSVSAHELGRDGPRLAAGLLAFGQAAKGLFPKLVAADLPGEAFLSVCATAGFTLATIKRADPQAI